MSDASPPAPSADALATSLATGQVTVTERPADAAALRARQSARPRHERLALLGQGAMGEVYVAHDRDLNRAVAIKRLDPQKATLAPLRDRFFVEAQITAQLDHPAIVPVHAIEADDNAGYAYAMKLVRGRTLAQVIADARQTYDDTGRVPEGASLRERLALLLPVCDAMAYAHTRGVVHRDLKPDNIMVGAFHEVLVMDWGLARILGDGPTIQIPDDALEHRAYQTQAGKLFGTPAYMSPEQARGDNDAVDARSDQYALGLVLFELACLRQAVTGAGGAELVRRAARADKNRVVFYSGRERIPRALVAIIDKATAPDPAHRYADVAALATDLRRFLADQATAALPDNSLTHVLRWISHHRAAALGIALVAVLAATGVAAYVYFDGQAALATQRQAAERREAVLSRLTSAVNDHVHTVNGELDRLESLLVGMTYAAHVAMRTDADPNTPLYWCRDFGDPTRAPADLAPSRVQQKPISVAHACLEHAPGTTHAGLGDRPRQLARMSWPLRRSYVQSAGPSALGLPEVRQAAMIRDGGIPLITVYLGTAEGIMVTYPGRDTLRDDYDPRKRPWYAPATATYAPLWIASDSASALTGLLLTCAMAVRDERGGVLGVAAIDLTFKHVIDDFLEPPNLGAPVEAYFINSDGGVVVQSSMRAIADKVNTLQAPPFPWPALLPRFAERPSGHAIVAGTDGRDQLVIWSRVPATAWTYVVVGADVTLLPAAPESVGS